jgi:hypothetical protein
MNRSDRCWELGKKTTGICFSRLFLAQVVAKKEEYKENKSQKRLG